MVVKRKLKINGITDAVFEPQDLWGDITGAAGSLVSSAVTTGTGIASATIGTVTNTVSGLVSGATSAVSGVVSTGENLVSGAVSTGTGLVSGVMRSGLSSLTQPTLYQTTVTEGTQEVGGEPTITRTYTIDTGSPSILSQISSDVGSGLSSLFGTGTKIGSAPTAATTLDTTVATRLTGSLTDTVDAVSTTSVAGTTYGSNVLNGKVTSPSLAYSDVTEGTDVGLTAGLTTTENTYGGALVGKAGSTTLNSDGSGTESAFSPLSVDLKDLISGGAGSLQSMFSL
jgi:hypothetical protein